MTDRERLMELFLAPTKIPENLFDGKDIVHKVAETYADVILSDGWIRPPCKVGDTVYKIIYCRCGNPECYEMKHCYKKETKRTPNVIDNIMLLQKGRRLAENSYRYEKPKFEWKPIGTICYKIIQKPFKLEWLTEIGKTVFLTREEAEKALAERRDSQ